MQPGRGHGRRRPTTTPPVGLLELPRGVGLLVVKRGSDDGCPVRARSRRDQAGRHPESDIFLDDITVSRRHAEFVTRDQITTVRDVGSLNGTYVNRERIEEARLSSGDEVQIGKFKLALPGGDRRMRSHRVIARRGRRGR